MIILASESASRKAMLTAAGVAFEAVPARIDEAGVTAEMQGRAVRDVADRLAELKAVKVSLRHPEQLVLGSDSMLEVEPAISRPLDPPSLPSLVRSVAGGLPEAAACGEQVLSSVGGYHLEGLGAQLFTRVEGDQFTVRGLPLLAVLGWLREAGELTT